MPRRTHHRTAFGFFRLLTLVSTRQVKEIVRVLTSNETHVLRELITTLVEQKITLPNSKRRLLRKYATFIENILADNITIRYLLRHARKLAEILEIILPFVPSELQE